MDKDKNMRPLKKYVLNILLAIDQLGNAIGGGDHDETISSRVGKLEKHYGTKLKRKRPFAYALSRFLDRIDDNHCEEAIEHDEGKNAVLDREI